MRSNNPPSTKPGLPAFRLIPVWLKGWKRFWVLSAAIYTLAYSIWIVVKWTDPAYETLIAGLGYLPLGLFAAISAIYAVNQKQLDQSTRRAWWFIALSLIVLSIGDITYVSLELTRGIGFPDIPDIFYLAYYPLAFIGLITIPTRVLDPSQKKTWGLDLAATIISAAAIFWYFIIAPTAAAGGEDWASRLVAGAYPVMDVLLLTSVASLLFRKSEINTRQSLYILGFGLLIYVIADIGYAWLLLQDLYFSGSFLDAVWTISYLLIGLAALRQADPYLVESGTRQETRTNWQASILPFVGVGAAVITSLFAASTGEGTGAQATGLFAGTTIAIFVLITRQIITMRENAWLVEDLSLATNQLRANAAVLEERVSERTRELENQTDRLRLAAQIARDAASAQDLDDLLNRSTSLLLDRFDLYHTGIFLMDQKREYAVLTASPTEAGQQMIADSYKIRVGNPDIVAQVAASGEPVIMLDSDIEPRRIKNALLPNTRSEMALPLKVEGNLIGVLDVQSEKTQGFNQDDVDILQILADQLASAIERARLLQQVQQNFIELEQAYGRSTRENWKSLFESGLIKNSGYRFDNIRIQPIREIPPLGQEAMQTGSTIVQNNGNPAQKLVAIPIKLRGHPIGTVTVSLKEGYSHTTVSTIEQVIERLAASLESARLFEEARLRADREQAISHVMTAISSAADYDAILRATVEEIGKTLGDSEVSIRIMEDLEK
jgi:GAF domain-containing protein